MKLLEFHIEIVQQICQENGLLVMGKGLGIERILCTILTIHTNPRNLILLLNCSDLELATLKKQLESASQILCSDLENEHVSMNDLKIINNETPAKERATLYFEGGVLAITSRILIVDILNHVIPTELVAGVIVNRAETVSETSSISFALRLYRGLNKSGFIRAFSESPQSFSGGLLSLETSLKTLQVRQIHLWPRFQFDVAACIDNSGSVELIEYRIGLTKRMNEIQVGLMDCITQSISELKRLHPFISSIDFTLENSLFKSFEYMIRKELDPIWHQASSKTKQIVQDLKTLRTLTHYLVSYDAVTFYSFLETIRAANSLAKTGGFRQNLHSWLLLDSANVVFACAKERVFLTKNQQPMIEEHPKWKALVAILREIEEERRASNRSFAGNVLIIAPEGIVAQQIRTIADKMETSRDYCCEGSKKILYRQLENYYQWKDKIPKEESRVAAPPPVVPESSRDAIVANAQDDLIAQHCRAFLDESSNPITQTHIQVKTVSGDSDDLNWTLLDTVRPHWVIMYSPNMGFVRKLEVFKALHPEIDLKVYFMVYDNSIEEQQYLTLLRREKESFEKLIHQKSNISIPIDDQGNILLDAEEKFWEKVDGRIAGGQVLQRSVRKVLVDIREFRCSLPMSIYNRRMEVIPVTLEIGDYILSNNIAVERKSPSDLSQSLRSGRLYKQCQALSLYYETPILLIEFAQNSAFRLTFSPYDAELDVPRRLVLIALHFPKVRFVWSTNPAATSEIFQDLQANEANPDLERAQNIGTGTSEQIDGDCDPTAAEMLLDIPGISFKNCHHVMSKVKNLKELSLLTLIECQDLIGEENGRKMFRFFNEPSTLAQ